MQLFTDNDLQQASRLTDNSRAILLRLTAMGCPKDVLAAFLSMDNVRKDHIRFLTGPVIQHRSPWAETTPPWLFRAIPAERLAIIFDEHDKGKPGWRIGPAELTAVMYPATMDAPMRLEYAEIYLWASAQANSRHYGISLDEIWQRVGGEPIPDRLINDPSGRFHNDYRQLCGDIRRRVIKAAPNLKGSSRSSSETAERVSKQLPLF